MQDARPGALILRQGGGETMGAEHEPGSGLWPGTWRRRNAFVLKYSPCDDPSLAPPPTP